MGGGASQSFHGYRHSATSFICFFIGGEVEPFRSSVLFHVLHFLDDRLSAPLQVLFQEGREVMGWGREYGGDPGTRAGRGWEIAIVVSVQQFVRYGVQGVCPSVVAWYGLDKVRGLGVLEGSGGPPFAA
jgi:hypothetical protein